MKKCGLCHKERPLVRSHLMPKSIYKSIKKFYSDANEEIINVRNDKKIAFTNDKQISKKFLCEECEERFNKNGENTILKEYKKKVNNFLLLDKVDGIKGYNINKNEKLLSPEDCKHLDIKSYIYFTASIFWRASVTKWHASIDNYYGTLNDNYLTKFRLFLLGKAKFPDNACIAVYVDDNIKKGGLMSFPTVKHFGGYSSHKFIIPGIKFVMFVGKDVKNPPILYHKGNLAFIKTSLGKSVEMESIRNLAQNEITPKGRLADKNIDKSV